MIISIENYVFNASAKTITFSDYVSIDIENIVNIINVKRDTVLYNPLNKKKGGNVVGNVLTLEDDTSIMGDNDPLYIVYDDKGKNQATAEKQDEIITAIESIPATDTSLLATESKQDAIIENQTDGTQKTQLVDPQGNPAEVDKDTNTLQTITYEHHEIHAGSHFYICDYQTTLANNATISFVLVTPNTAEWTHMSLDFSSILGASLDVYEGASDVVGGTTTTAFNNDRNSNKVSSLTIIKDPSSITTGTKIAGYLAGANRTAGFVQRDREIILKQNETYLFRFTSLANSNSISFCGEWYEHQNKN